MTGIKIKREVEKHHNIAKQIRFTPYSRKKNTQKTQLSYGQGHIHPNLPRSHYNRMHNWTLAIIVWLALKEKPHHMGYAEEKIEASEIGSNFK